MSVVKRLGNFAPRLKVSVPVLASMPAARSERKSSTWVAERFFVPRESSEAVSAPRPCSFGASRPSPPGQAMESAV